MTYLPMLVACSAVPSRIKSGSGNEQIPKQKLETFRKNEVIKKNKTLNNFSLIILFSKGLVLLENIQLSQMSH